MAPGAQDEPAGGRSRLIAVRHGDTAWSLAGRHTGRSDPPLADTGREQARQLAARLSGCSFSAVFVSPLARAKETCAIAGFAGDAVEMEDLSEWDYGLYEGRTTAEIRSERPGWDIWKDGPLGGETLASLSRRAQRVVSAVRAIGGDVLVVAHGHLLRVVAARWVGLPASTGRSLVLGPGALSVLGFEREHPAIVCWNSRATTPLARA